MRRKNRQINIFSVSALDLFASAMGVFLIIAVVSLPYYLKTHEEERTINSMQEKIKKSKNQTEFYKQKYNALMKNAFCVIKIEWKEENAHDVDLHVIDANGNRFYYKQPEIKGDDYTSLTVDAGYPELTKFGTEVWFTKRLQKGIYTIEYDYAKGNPPVTVKGTIFTRAFDKKLPTKIFEKIGKVKVATFSVDELGNVTLNTY